MGRYKKSGCTWKILAQEVAKEVIPTEKLKMQNYWYNEECKFIVDLRNKVANANDSWMKWKKQEGKPNKYDIKRKGLLCKRRLVIEDHFWKKRKLFFLQKERWKLNKFNRWQIR